MSWLVGILIVVGTLLMLIASIGLLRMPDVYTRMHAATKAVSLGAGLILVGVALHFANLMVTTKVITTTIFIFLTAPVAAHLLARAAYFRNVPRWEKTVVDELEGRFDHRSHSLASSDTDTAAPAPDQADDQPCQDRTGN